MANILLNAFKSATGGGKVIVESFIAKLSHASSDDTYYFLVQNKKDYERYECKHIKILTLPIFLSSNISLLILYLIIFPVLLFRLRIDLVFNFGDVIIPTKRKQIYFFDWAYAITDHDYIWNNMSLYERFVRKFKKALIKYYIKRVTLVVCQSEHMRDGLIGSAGVKDDNILVLPTPVSININRSPVKNEDNFDSQKCISLFFPSSFAPHKNFSFILKVAKLIDNEGISARIILTIEKEETYSFWKKIEDGNIKSIQTIGKVPHGEIMNNYLEFDALFFPSLLESYGIPLVEAMFLHKVILVSDLPYSRVLCKDAAFYFDPFDPDSAIKSIKTIISNREAVNEKIANGSFIISNLPTWDIFFQKIFEAIKVNLKN